MKTGRGRTEDRPARNTPRKRHRSTRRICRHYGRLREISCRERSGKSIDRELELRLPDIDNLAAMEAASNRLRAIIEQTPMDNGLEAALRDAYDELCFRHGDVGLSVAVRSSAAGEDALNASFAGQYESYLGIVGAEAVIAAVRRAWSSLFVARALAYRLHQKQHYRETPMGVGVLRLVHARCAGVAFSANPVSKKRDRFVIEAAWGWGESVVQGTVEPDRVEVDRIDGRSSCIAPATNALRRCSIAFMAASPSSRYRNAFGGRSASRRRWLTRCGRSFRKSSASLVNQSMSNG